MSAALKPKMTLEAFLDWECRQEIKYEFDGFRPVAMTGGTWSHAAIQRDLIGLLYNRLRNHRCQEFGSELKIQAGHSIRYPDAFVVCSPAPPGTLVLTDPAIVFEILSESTSHIDRIERNREYRDAPSIQRYVILEQTKSAATVHARVGEAWVVESLAGDRDVFIPDPNSKRAWSSRRTCLRWYDRGEFRAGANTVRSSWPRAS
jgi:Uma2 family endonuclease